MESSTSQAASCDVYQNSQKAKTLNQHLSYPFRNINAELFHFVLKVLLVVAQRAFEEVARRLGQRLDTSFVKPSVATRCPQVRVAQELSVTLALFHILLGDVL